MAHDAAIGEAGDRHLRHGNRIRTDQAIKERADEGHVVHAIQLGWRVAAAVVPTALVALGVGDDEALLIGNGVESRPTANIRASDLAAVQHE